MRAERRDRPMNHRPIAVDPPRQQRGIFILRRHDHAEPFKASEVFGQRQGNAGSAARKGRVCHGVLFKFRDVGDAGIFDAPNLFRVVARVRRPAWAPGRCASPSMPFAERAAQRWDSPRRSSTRQRSNVSPSGSLHCPGIEDAVDRIRPILPAENGIAGIAREQRMLGRMLSADCFEGSEPLNLAVREVMIGFKRRHSFRDAFLLRLLLWPACMSSSAIRNESVDSAPWFSLTRSG